MPLAVANNPGFDDFEILSRVYLDSLLARRSVHWAGIYELADDQWILRAYRGPDPHQLAFPFKQTPFHEVYQSKTRVYSKAAPSERLDSLETTSSWFEPIAFETEVNGILRIEEVNEDAFQESDASLFSNISAQIAPFFAWKGMALASRLEMLSRLAELQNRFSDFDWVGIYRVDDARTEVVLSLYFGEPTDHLRIPLRSGICGAAIRDSKTINVPNVKADPRFIACSVRTQSELVVPIRNAEGIPVAEIDIDSCRLAAFPPERVAAVEACAQRLEPLFTEVTRS